MGAKTPLPIDKAHQDLGDALRGCDSKRLSKSLLAAQSRLLVHAVPSGKTYLSALIIEDNTEVTGLLVETIRDLSHGGPDFNIRTCESVAQATRLVQQERPDVILLDLGLPDSYGKETLSKIRYVAGSVPIIVISGTNDTPEAELKKAGAAALLIKGNCSVVDVLDTLVRVILS